MKYCQGPICHEHRTKDRIRGTKGAMYYATRRRTHMYYNGNFCSLNCQDDWFRTFGNQAIDHFGRVTEAKRTDCDNAWYKSYDWRNGTNHYFVNDLLGRRISITREQYNNPNLVRP